MYAVTRLLPPYIYNGVVRPFLCCLGVLALLCLPYATAQTPKRLNDQTTKQPSEQTADSLIVADMRREGVRFSHDNAITLLPNGTAKFNDMLSAISQAQSSVHLEYFNFRNDSIGNLLFDLLARKVNEGVEVRALFDGFGNDSNNKPLRKRHLRQLRERGIKIAEFDPVRFPWVNHVFARDHRKIVIIDGRIAYTGGMNVADYYIVGTPQVGEWHDMHCRLEGSEVETLQQIFLNIWRKTTGEQVYGTHYWRGLGEHQHITALQPDTTATAGKKMVGVVNREPRATNHIIREFYLSAINHAQQQIRIINPYPTLIPRITRALKRAARRGVDVQILISARSDIPLTPDCGYYNAHKLMKAGCKVWVFEPGFHHTKTLTVDGRLCSVGSANLNARSLCFDYEENLVIADSCTTHELDQLFEREKQRSFQLTPERWKQWRTPWQRFRGWLAHLLAPWL